MPTRMCAQCGHICHTRCKKCPGCGQLFPPSKKRVASGPPRKYATDLLSQLQRKVCILLLSTVHTYIYRIVGILCEVLICVNHASCHGLADFNSIGLLHTLLSQLSDWSARAIVPCMWLHIPSDIRTKHPCRHGILWSLSHYSKRFNSKWHCMWQFLCGHVIWYRIASQI